MSVYEGQVLDQSKGVRLQLVTDTDAHFSHFMPVNHKTEYGLPHQNHTEKITVFVLHRNHRSNKLICVDMDIYKARTVTVAQHRKNGMSNATTLL